ncbi:hypothetical protein A8H32_25410 [Burkholderia thailandensis]|nr:hypothetical protein AQ475_22520 [Burkholderia thailandensis]AVR28262.1 hypothetical protein A8H32_25410 [Burkholderia thailandensis]TGB33548.1 hypothetical protein C6946_11805 [Burkholderia thailandensis]
MPAVPRDARRGIDAGCPARRREPAAGDVVRLSLDCTRSYVSIDAFASIAGASRESRCAAAPRRDLR